jgi:hypothetical protein
MADKFIQVKAPGLKEAYKSVKRIEKEQFPFGYALALTRMAQRGQELTRERTREHFQLHGNFIPNNIKIHGAQKSDILRYGYAESEVYTDPKIAFMTLHEEGGTKRPWFHKALALPSLAMKVVAGFRTATGKIAKRWKPSALLRQWNSGKRKKRGRKASTAEPKAFVAKGKVMVRLGPPRYPLQTLYQFEGTTKIKPLWNMEPIVRKAVDKEFDGIFKRSMKDAVGSALVP